MNKKRRTRHGTGALIGLLAFILVFSFLYVFYGDRLGRLVRGKFQGDHAFKRTTQKIYGDPEGQKKPETRRLFSPAKQTIAIIIDDIGCDLSPVRELLNVDAPIAFAILPSCPHSQEASEMIHRAGKEILLHLPMEPHAFPEVSPGPGALLLSMKDEELKRQIDEALRRVHHVKGINNHMGSKFMEEEKKLSVVLSYIKDKGFFFVDSRTTASSKAQDLSKKMGLRFLSRSAFIDNNQDYTSILGKLNHLSEKKDPLNKDPHVMIGHPYPGTIWALKEAIPHLKAKGVDIVTVSEMMDITARRNAFSLTGPLWN